MAATKQLPVWDELAAQSGADCSGLVAKNAKVAETVQSLSCVMAAVKADVEAYVASFQPFSFLWQTDLAVKYAAFMATNPQLEVCHSFLPILSVICWWTLSMEDKGNGGTALDSTADIVCFHIDLVFWTAKAV